MLDTLKNIKSSEKSISEKRKDLLRVINKNMALNININLDKVFDEKEVISLIETSLNKHGIKNDFHYSITDKNGLLFLNNFENIDNSILEKSTSYSVEFLNDDFFNEKRIFTLYILKLERVRTKDDLIERRLSLPTTNFLKDAKKNGNKVENGKMMFIYQAQRAFKIWHDIQPEIDDQVIKLLDL